MEGKAGRQAMTLPAPAGIHCHSSEVFPEAAGPVVMHGIPLPHLELKDAHADDQVCK